MFMCVPVIGLCEYLVCVHVSSRYVFMYVLLFICADVVTCWRVLLFAWVSTFACFM